jgi:GAF domain-containing protein
MVHSLCVQTGRCLASCHVASTVSGVDADDFAEMALSLHDEPTIHDTVERVLDYALKAVNCTSAGIIFVHAKNRVETVATTHPMVADFDRVQFECGQGPDINVTPDRYSVLVSDTRTDSRWPDWARYVADAGVRSVLGTRLYTSATTIGSLNLYDAEANHFSVEDQQVAHILARHAAVALDSAKDTANLWRAIDARKTIGQAQGILMERFSIDADRAFAVLRRYSQDNNIKLHAVAERLIATRELSD